MNRHSTLLSVSIAALALSATFATAWAQKPAGTPGAPSKPAGSTGAASSPATPSSSASAAANAPSSPGAAPSASASAAPSASPSASAGATAPPTGTPDELFRRGNELAKKDQWADAEPLYRAAWEQKKSYDIAGNLGLAEFQQRKWRDAAEHLSFAVKSFPASGKPENRALLENIFGQTKAEVGSVTVKVSMPGADVTVDGKRVGVSPLGDTIFVDPGSRIFEATLTGYEPAIQGVEAAKGSAQEVTLTLTQKQAPIKIEPDPGWRPKPVYLIAGGAVAGVGLVAGIAFTVVANGKASDAEALRSTLGGPSACYQPAGSAASPCADLTSHLESQGTFSNLAVASFVVGGAFALGTAGLAAWSYLSPASPPSDATSKTASSAAATAKATARIVPVVDASMRGAAIVGRW